MLRYFNLLVFLMAYFPLIVAQGNVKAEYYNGVNFEEYVGVEYVATINFYWDRVAPIHGINPNYCSVRYTGQLKPPKTGTFIFSARVDDGIRVWINDSLIISNWQLNDKGYSQGKMFLTANENYSIKIEYFNALNEAEIRLLWKLPKDPNRNWFSRWWYGEDPEIIPAEYLLPPLIEEIDIAPKVDQDLTSSSLPKEDPPQKPISKVKPKPKPEPTPITKVEPPLQKKSVLLSQSPPSKNVSVKSISRDTLEKYIPRNVNFEKAKSEILADSYNALNTLASFLVNNPERRVKIEGHTDNIGDSKKNLILSEDRAKSIAAYLLDQGVELEQIVSAKGYGDTMPIAHSDGKKYHPENRRVEFTIE